MGLFSSVLGVLGSPIDAAVGALGNARIHGAVFGIIAIEELKREIG